MKSIVIVNADDYGKDRETTEAIDWCFDNQYVTHSTCMVNMPFCMHALNGAATNGYIDRIGLHLNLSEGFPLTDEIRKSPVFCRESGEFSGNYRKKCIKRLFLTQRERKAIELELSAQIDAFFAMGGRYLHADSHHHVHFDWSISSIALPLLKRRGFKTVRISYNVALKPFCPVWIYRNLWNIYLQRVIGSRTDYFTAVDGFLRSKVSGSVEVMVHPIMVNGEVRDGARGALMSELARDIALKK